MKWSGATGRSGATTSTPGWDAPTGGTIQPPEDRLVRFSRPVRLAHWSAAALLAVTSATAAGLYLPGVAAAVGRRDLLRTLHVVSGILLLGPLAATLAGPGRPEARALSRWEPDDFRWLRSRGRVPPPGKFNAGQKLFAALVAGAIPAMALTGSVMRWFGPFPLAWRTGATFVHDWLALGLLAGVGGHIALALADPGALAGMARGSVRASWATAHPGWSAEVTGQPPRDAPPGGRAARPTVVTSLTVVVVAVAAVGAALVHQTQGDGPPGPASVAVAYQEAVARGDAARLFDLSGPELRRGRPKEVFIEDTTAELLATADDRGGVTRVTAGPVDSEGGETTVAVRIDYIDGLGQPQSITRSVRLRRYGAAWRVTSAG